MAAKHVASEFIDSKRDETPFISVLYSPAPANLASGGARALRPLGSTAPQREDSQDLLAPWTPPQVSRFWGLNE